MIDGSLSECCISQLDRFYEIFTTKNFHVGDYHKLQCRQMIDESLSECGIGQLDRFCVLDIHYLHRAKTTLFLIWHLWSRATSALVV